MSASTQFDLIVLGGGLAGHCAALEAAGRGARVLLAEKMDRHGGSTVYSSGSFAFAGTAAQRDKGIQDDDARLRADIEKAAGGRCDPALVQLFLDRQIDTYEWLQAQGVVFEPIALSSNQGVPRSHPVDPHRCMDALHARVRAHPGIQWRAGSAAVDLLDGPAGVSGVRLRDSRGEAEVRARCGVVLACGGFARDPSLVGKFAPHLEQALVIGGAGNVGDGLRMAWKRGADLRDVAFINGTFGISLNRYPDTRVLPEDDAVLRLAIYKGAIAVNRLGRRFANESISYKSLGELCLAQPGGIGFQVFDAKIMAQSAPAPNSNDLADAFARGLVRSGPTPRAIADAVGIPADALEATLAAYNAGIDTGMEPEFGRATLGKDWGRPTRIDTAPFYIYPCTTAILGTYCGIRVDASMRVIDVYGAAIPGLFAAGEIVGGFHGAGYMSGTALSKAAIFGRVAGFNATRGG
ncbi:MAG: FAD-dependent oxidoreductase [Gammaproteobacteria bacterium]